MKLSKKTKALITLIALFAIINGYGFYYLNTYYKASQEVTAYFNDNAKYTSTVKNGYIEFVPKTQKKETGFIFYPGGKVDYKAYAPIISRIAQEGYYAAIVKMPFNLAVFNVNGADKVISNNPNTKKWVIGGHSLGGVMSAKYAIKNSKTIKGIVFLAAYPDKDMSKLGIKVLSLKGTKDGLISKEKYNSEIKHLPVDAIIKLIQGGNHCNFGNYGFQKGDNESSISREEQQNQTVKEIVGFLNGVNK